ISVNSPVRSNSAADSTREQNSWAAAAKRFATSVLLTWAFIASARQWSAAVPAYFSKSHDVKPAVDVDYFAGNAAAGVRRQEHSGAAHFFDFHAAAERGAFFVAFKHVAEAGDAARGQSFDRAGGNGVYANLFLAQFVGEIAHRALESGLGHSHHVVAGHDFLRCIVSHGHDRATVFHERGGGTRDCDQRVDAHVERNAEAFARRVEEVALEFVGGGVGDRVHQRVQFAVAFFERGEEAGDVVVFRYVAHIGFGAGQGENEVPGFLLQALVLVGNGQLHAGGVQSLGDGPGNRTLVGDSEDDAGTAL